MTIEQRINYFRKGLSGSAVQVLWVLYVHSHENTGWIPDDICEQSGLQYGDVMRAVNELVERQVIGGEITDDGNYLYTFL